MINSPASPPQWSLIQGIRASSAMNLMEFVSMTEKPEEFYGKVYNFSQFLEWISN